MHMYVYMYMYRYVYIYIYILCGLVGVYVKNSCFYVVGMRSLGFKYLLSVIDAEQFTFGGLVIDVCVDLHIYKTPRTTYKRTQPLKIGSWFGGCGC